MGTFKYQTTINVALTGLGVGGALAHGLGTAPDEITVLSTLAVAAGQTYRYAAADATNIYLANGTAAGSAVVTATVWHSIIK